MNARVIQIAEHMYRDLAEDYVDMVEKLKRCQYSSDQAVQSASLYISVQLEKRNVPVKDFNVAVKAELKRRGLL